MLVGTWHHPEINYGIASYARKAGWFLRDVSRSLELPTHCTAHGIISYVRPENKGLRKQLARYNVPIVNLAYDNLKGQPFPKVLPDNAEIGALAARHLIGRGLKNLVFFSWIEDALVVRERLKGFCDEATLNGIEVTRLHVSSQKDPNLDVTQWLAKILPELPKPSGVFCHYDVEAEEVLYSGLEAGIPIPDSLSIVGVDNDYIHCELGPIPLTSVDCDFLRIGYTAAETLGQMMDGETVPPITRVPPKEIAVRLSSDLYAISNANLRAALQFIRANFAEPIDADAVAQAARISQRQLYRLFETHLGRTIHDEILKHRLRYGKRLLTATNHKIEFIALELGFGSGERFSKVFRTMEGVSPSAYRAETSGSC